MRLQLGHPRGEPCGNPLCCAGDDFIVLHVNGIHQVSIDFCGCGKDNQLPTVQLICLHLYPATVKSPKTCATTAVLDLFSMLSYESKMSAYQFYQTLSRITDNTGLDPPPVSRQIKQFQGKYSPIHNARIGIQHSSEWLTNGGTY